MSAPSPHTSMIDRTRLAALRVTENREFEHRTLRSRSLHKRGSGQSGRKEIAVASGVLRPRPAAMLPAPFLIPGSVLELGRRSLG